MSRERMFPVLWQVYGEERDRWVALGCPRWIPWHLLEAHEAQARRNHDQTLKRLAERGGLCPSEIMCAVEGRELWPIRPDIDEIPRLVAWLAAQGAP